MIASRRIRSILISSHYSSSTNDWQTTHWSMVLSARENGSVSDEQWQASMQSLCQAYWYPLYVYLRRKGYQPEDAQDLTQDFFATLIEKDFLKVVNPKQGRFRWFLMDSISKFAANWNKAQSAQKRGGDKRIFSINVEEGENRYVNEPADQWTPERLFDRQWALTLLNRSLDRLRKDYTDSGKIRYFDELQVYLIADSQAPSYSETAEKLGLSLTAIKVAIHRLREKHQATVRTLVAETLDDQQNLDEEIDALLTAL